MRIRTLIPAFLSLLLLALPTQAQTSRDPDRPNVEGRNDFLERSFAKVAEDVSVHVVKLASLRGTHLGYGVVIDDGFVLTHSGILPQDGASVRAQTKSGQTYTATISGRNKENDIALLRLAGGDVPRGITKGSDGALPIGQFVASVGITNAPLAVGVISAKNRPVEPAKHEKNILMGMFSDGNDGPKRSYPSVIQYDGPLQAEFFGAPLVDSRGRLIGINVGAPYRGSSHAVGIDQINTFIGSLKSAPKRPFLGMSAAETEVELRGGSTFALEVREVQPGGPAERAGLQKGDIVLKVEGRSLSSLDGFADQIMGKRPGDLLEFTLLRGAVEVVLEVKLGAR